MHSCRKFAGVGGLAVLAAAGSALACSDHTSPLCLCPSASSTSGGSHDHSALKPIEPRVSPSGQSRTLGSGGGSSVLNGGPEATIVHVFNFEYSLNPSGGPIVDATINAGETIRWQWDSGFHSVTSVAGSAQTYDSGILIGPGPTYDRTFTSAGVYNYYCTLHGFDNGDGTASGMAGTITVVPGLTSSAWNVDFDGSWQTAANWTNSAIPNGAGHAATFGPIITAPRGVLVDAPVTVGSLNFNSASPRSYLIAGGSTLSLSGAGGGVASIAVSSGTHTITARVQAVTDTTLAVGPADSTLTTTRLEATTAALTKTGAGRLVANTVRASALTVDAGTVAIAANGTDAAAGRIGILALAGGPNAPTASLDLNDNDLVLTATSVTSAKSMILASRNGGTWDQPGLTSSAARTQAAHATTLGLMSGADWTTVNGGPAPFAGFTISASDALMKYTWYGDADFNGAVDFDDYVRIDSGFNGGLGGWLNGDFDLSDSIDFDDYVLIDLAFNAQSGALRRAIDFVSGDDRTRADMTAWGLLKVVEHFDRFGADYATHFLSAVPEPTVVPGLALPVAAWLARRRRTGANVPAK